jgi:hypothetical protein
VAYTYCLGNDIGKVRLLIADTDIGNATFSDEEITFALDTEGGLYMAAAMLLRVLAADQSRLAVRVSRSGVSEDLTQVAVQLRAQADAYTAKAGSDAGSISATVSPSWEPFSYTDNLLAGRDV